MLLISETKLIIHFLKSNFYLMDIILHIEKIVLIREYGFFCMFVSISPVGILTNLCLTIEAIVVGFI